MTVFATVIDILSLDYESQGTEYDWLYLVLKVADVYETANPTEDEYENPFKEVLRRFRALTNEPDGHAVIKMAKLFGTRAIADKYPWR